MLRRRVTLRRRRLTLLVRSAGLAALLTLIIGRKFFVTAKFSPGTRKCVSQKLAASLPHDFLQEACPLHFFSI